MFGNDQSFNNDLKQINDNNTVVESKTVGEKEESGLRSSEEKIKFISDSGTVKHIIQNKNILKNA